MKNISILILALVTIISFPLSSKAQAQLGLYTTSVSNSTPILGDQLSIFTKLKNVSSTDTFSGTVNFLLANKDSIITNVSIVGKPAWAGTSITLAPLEEKAALFTVQLLPSYFKVGPDIIIVWPVSIVKTVDTARAPIRIFAPLSITSTIPNLQHLYVANEQLIIQNSENINGLQQLRIFDSSGRLIESHFVELNSTTIPIHHLPQGIYIAEIKEENGSIKRIKFVR